MTVTAANVLAEVGADAEDADLAARVLTEAAELVRKYLQDHADPAAAVEWPDGYPADWPTDIPDPILDRAVLGVCVHLFNSSKAPNGVLMQQYDSGDDGSAVALRIGRDPLAAIRGLLAPWCGGGGRAPLVAT